MPTPVPKPPLQPPLPTYIVNVCWDSKTTALAQPGPIDPHVTFMLVSSTTPAHPHGEFVVKQGDSIAFLPYGCAGYQPFEISFDPKKEDSADVVASEPIPMSDGSIGAKLTFSMLAKDHEVLAYMSVKGASGTYSVASGKPVIRNGPFAGFTGSGNGHFPGGDPTCWVLLALLLASLGYIGWSKMKMSPKSGT